MDKFIAITGGIGSGKSTAAEIIKNCGFTVLSADGIYAELLKEKAFVDLVCNATGTEPIFKDGEYAIDRKKISETVFSDPEKLKKLNSATHPAVMDELKRRAAKEKGVVFAEVPLLYEGNFQDLFDRIIVVIRPDEDRFAAVALRDGKDKEEIKKIAENQFDYSSLSQNEKTVVIANDGDGYELERKIKSVLRSL